METEKPEPQPTPREARAALAAARAEEQATINRPVPAWYYPVLAVALFALFAVNSINKPTGTTRVVQILLLLALAMGIGALVGSISARHAGYKNIHIPWRPTILAMLVAAVFPIAAFTLDDVVGSWVWIASGAGLAALVLVIGIPYQRKHRRG